MPTKGIKCFVAMAFGREDCDTLYDRHIVPALTSFKIDPIRVDRREHKDDLNNYIIRMLRESDIALVDLTYSRPSVYYEAGFAERQIPVIYTVRKDHLSRSQPDDRLRVHFDLEMKKIVPWHDPNDLSFVRRLRRRIAYLAKPIIRQRQEDKVIERDRREFASLSVASRCREIYKKFELMLQGKRFWTVSLKDIIRSVWGRLPVSEILIGIELEALIGIKKVNKTCQLCGVLVAESLTKNQIGTAITSIRGFSLIDHHKDIIDYEDHFFLCSLKKVPVSRLTGCFPSAQPTESPTTFTLKQESIGGDRDRRVSIYLISPIDSMARLRAEIRSNGAKLTDKRSNQHTYLVENSRGERKIQFERKKQSSGENWRLIYPRRESFRKK
jgi:nucleoside 2-deoxyribosyltransferase